jgi:hypothetical protein
MALQGLNFSASDGSLLVIVDKTNIRGVALLKGRIGVDIQNLIHVDKTGNLLAAWSPTPEDWTFVGTAVNASTLSAAEKTGVMSQLHLIYDNGGQRKCEVLPEVQQQVKHTATELVILYYGIDLPPTRNKRDGQWSGCFGYCADGTHNNLAEIAGKKMGVSSIYMYILNEHSSDPDVEGPFFGNDYVSHSLQMCNHYSGLGAKGKSEEYANIAKEHYRVGRYEQAYTNLSWAMHFMSDVGNPWHTSYDPLIQTHHKQYELDYVEGKFVGEFKQPLLDTPSYNNYYITNVSTSVQTLADFSNTKISYLNSAIEQDPNWMNNATVKEYTIQLLKETLRYNEGLVNYVQRG